MEKGESIDPHSGGGGLVCQGEDDAWKQKEKRKQGREKDKRKGRGEGRKGARGKNQRMKTCWEDFLVQTRAKKKQ